MRRAWTKQYVDGKSSFDDLGKVRAHFLSSPDVLDAWVARVAAKAEAALAQFIYLVAFSYAFFLKGFTGLAITIGSIITLFVVMQVTGRIRWKDKFATAGPVQSEATA